MLKTWAHSVMEKTGKISQLARTPLSDWYFNLTEITDFHTAFIVVSDTATA